MIAPSTLALYAELKFDDLRSKKAVFATKKKFKKALYVTYNAIIYNGIACYAFIILAFGMPTFYISLHYYIMKR